ncbi:hypothetical protein, partial [Bacillus thuringiensis]|uniref:hypothetical protein n=1 Tax=Bacillus thuringiensis TaxID=1428 RepID=UPI001642CCB4
MKKELEPFLPSAEEFQQLDGFELDDWAGRTRSILMKRKKMRDPRFYLKNGVSQHAHQLKAFYYPQVQKNVILS